MNIGIISQGFVGNAVYQKFKDFFDVFTFDLIKELSNSSIEEIKGKCRIIFICVFELLSLNLRYQKPYLLLHLRQDQPLYTLAQVCYGL